jgi:hypothetical protein
METQSNSDDGLVKLGLWADFVKGDQLCLLPPRM